MALQVEVLFKSPLSDLWGWARHHAEAEGMTLAEYVDRLVEVDRRKVEGLPRLDPRTKHVGRRGAAVHLHEGEFLAGQVATLAAIDPARISVLTELGIIRSARPTGRGVPGAYADVDVLLAAVTGRLHDYGVPASACVELGEQIRVAWPRTRGLVAIASHENGRLVGETSLGAMARGAGVVVAVHLEHVVREIEERDAA